ncbi:ATP-dependent DNA helicase [Methanohalophilus sp. DAL1]|uniref:ATP-dependent DNA helicase n=1 Tax=Methanohalophilus sp. DAL1 TaxID=1864608 RepID=UPI000818436A|nr:ATP-dependent DNA helicase [Methanohalophilus sp. DAL1]OBZ35469.1 MAG: damage-inducible protein [Methanohalophilus sp. DAL1]
MSTPDNYIQYFPLEQCYPNQKDAMEKIHRSLLEENLVLFEGACGTGKTLSALVPSLHVGKQLGKTVFIATNVHQQMLQFIDEARQIKRTHDIKVLVFKGKMGMCPLKQGYDECEAKRDNTYDLMEIEKEINLKKQESKAAWDEYKSSGEAAHASLRDAVDEEREKLEEKASSLRKRSCDPLYEVLRAEDEKFQKWLFQDVRDPEEVNDYAAENGMCGYELLKRELKNADLVIANFHHILNDMIFSTMLRWMDKEPEDLIAIFDEAHNIENAARSHSSITLTEHAIESALAELNANEKSDLFTSMPVEDVEAVLSILLEVVRDTYDNRFKFGERQRVGRNWYDIRISDPYERNDVVYARFMRRMKETGYGEEKQVQELLGIAAEVGGLLDNAYHEQYKQGQTPILKRSHLKPTAEFFSQYLKLCNNENYYPVLNVRRDQGGEIYGRLELFTCIPKNVTGPLLDSIYSAILMSATLRPFDMIKSTLGITRQTCDLAYGLTFPEERRLTLAVSVPPQYSRIRDDPQNLQILEQVLQDTIENAGGNVIIFFPNAFEAKRYFRKFDGVLDVELFLDETGVSAQDIRKQFFQTGEQGGKAVLFTYLWGTLSEGVDYRNGRGRVVVVVGVGYSALNDRMHAVESAYDHEFGYGAGWEYAVQVPTIRKIRQAMGRVVRSPTDYGVRILLDGRFMTDSVKRLGKYSVYPSFPEDERKEFLDVEPGKVKYSLLNFFSDMEELS